MTKPRSPKHKPSARARTRRARFLQKPGCTTCTKARKLLEERGFHLQFRDLWDEPLSAAELEKLIGPRDHADFLNTHSGAIATRIWPRTRPPAGKPFA